MAWWKSGGEPPRAPGEPVTAGPRPGGPRRGAVGPGQPGSSLPGLLPLSGVVTQTPLYVTVTLVTLPRCPDRHIKV